MRKNKILFNIRFFLRRIIYFKNYQKLKEILKNNEDLKEIFEKQPKYYNDMLCKSYGTTNFNFNLSFEIFSKDISVITAKFPNILKKSTKIYQNENINIQISTYPKVISEGLFNINLYYKNTKLYTLNFVLLNDAFLITALQGGLNSKSENKDFTKEYFGLRPLNFIIFFAFKFANFLGFDEICGVKDKYLISRFKRNKKRGERIFIIPNYDEIWQENTNILKEHKSFYTIEFLQKNLEEIPSKKRSMYKKRYDFLKSIEL